MKPPKDLILKYIKDNEISYSWLARRLKMEPQNFWKKLHRQDIPATLIAEISKGLSHNFFADLAMQFDKEHKPKREVLDYVMEEQQAKYGDDKPVLRRIIREEIKKALKNG